MSDNSPNGNMETLPPASQNIVDQAKIAAYGFMNPAYWQMVKTVAQTFFESGAVPAAIKNAQQMVMVIQAGHECGLQPIEALNSFYFVNGKISLYGEMGITLVRRAKHKIAWGECNDQTATVTITRADTGESLSQTFTMLMANTRGLTSKGGPWKTAPDNMLKYKAFWATARFLVPDALHGIRMKEELEEMQVVDDKGHVDTQLIAKDRKKMVVDSIPAEHKPLEQALDEGEEETKLEAATTEVKDMSEKKPRKKIKDVAAEAQERVTAVVDEATETSSVSTEQVRKEESANARRMRHASEKARYDAIVEKELGGTALTDEEKGFARTYKYTEGAGA